MKKIFTLLTLLVAMVTSAWAGTAIISPANMTSQVSGTLGSTTAGNVWYGNGTGLATGYIIQITGNKGKALSNQGTVTIGSTGYASFKNSNGAQNTITLPSGNYASSVTFYVTANADGDAKLSEFNGTSCNDAVTSHRDGANPTVITKTLGNVNSFTFTFSTNQVLFVAVVTYDQPTITTQPISATYQKNEAASALTVAATASIGDLSYLWYSCDDANMTNAAAIVEATSASYTPSTSANGTFYYFCHITDSKGNTDSDVATITVSEATAPTISVEASSTSVFINAAVTLTATVGGVPAPTVQWYSCDDDLKTNPAAIDGATNTTYAPSTAATGIYYFYAVATNSQGSATSDVITLTVNPLYTVTYSLGGVTGTVGAVPASVDVGSSLTIPVNKTLYKDGYTLTAWNDGSADHAIGSNMTVTTNTTLTPVFTANETNAHLGYNSTTVTWQFQTGQGAPAWSMQGNGTETKFYYVAQTTVGGSSIDVLMTMDATNGKINNSSWSDWTQMITNTKLTVPVLAGAEVKLYAYQEGTSKTTFEGNTGTYASNIYTYTATADGNLDVVIGDESYFKYLSVTYPSETAVLTVSANNTIVPLTKENINSEDYLAVTTNNWTTDKTYGDYSGDFYNMSSTDRKLTIKVTGASVFEVLVQNDTAGRTYLVKVGDNDAQEITHAGGGVKSSGAFAIADPSATTTITLSGGGSNANSVYPVAIKFNPTASVNTKADRNYASYVTTSKLDFASSEGITAYIATGLNGAGDAVELSPVDIVPAGTPIIVKTDTKGATVNVPVTAADASDVSENKLVAGDGTTVATSSHYYLANDLFHQANAGTLQSGKAYLYVTTLAPVLTIDFGGTTGIDSVKGSEIKANGEYYNLNGQRVANPTKGLYIVNGKKVILK